MPALVNPTHDPSALRERYAEGHPFPHIVLDDFLLPSFAHEVTTDLEQFSSDDWYEYDSQPEQYRKRSVANPNLMPETVVAALYYMNSPEVRGFLEELTGIEDIHSDPSFFGGGVHISLNGGHLDVHADFNLHPETGMHRRINALLFLNRDWQPEWNGQLELWERDLSAPAVSINPAFNRLVVFSITDDAFHGFPTHITCPDDRRRLSLALYYYTDTRPVAEMAPFHWAAWQYPSGLTPAPVML
jgi:Rps23 Pro-64 3,4-dihydroxylase Tpa1-like proline 4-hydroxylase